jgi:hypothetical protein
MNCLDFQRQLNADPRRLGPEAAAHAETCVDCAQRLAKQMRVEAELAQALLVAPPEGLADQVLLAARLERRRRRTRLVAMAASLFVAAGIGLSLPQWQREDLAAIGIAHVLSEPQYLATGEAASQQDVAVQFARLGARLAARLPAVHAKPCEVPGGGGAHIVLDTPHGRVTVLLIPNRKGRTGLGKRDLGLISMVESAGRGCYTLVAFNQAALDYAREMLRKSLRWT